MAVATQVATTSELSFATGVIRQYDYWATVAKRTWRASVVSSLLSPIFYVVAMGVLLGGFIEGDPDQLEGATSYLAFIVPGLVAAHAMQTAVGETTYPVMGMFKWHKTYEGMAATPLEPRHLAGAHLTFVAFRLATTCGVFMLVLVPFGLFESWWGPILAYLSQILVGMAFATLVYGLTCRMQRETGFGVLFRLGVFPLFLFSGAFFPVSNLPDGIEWLAWVSPLWHGVDLTRMLTLGTVDPPLALLHLVVLVALAGAGYWWAVRRLTRRLMH
jgi:lipooligosaccharide transport system permease protein